uniref:Uncharacterized protein n=1 Tax=Myoviridae sp. ctA4D8 TaxID=2823535 RepID=A0A8S5L6N5_9CAUD|nr:MAG TPA: hypothetical protein [Myoviridae sp. ctA4D8]
MSYISFLKLHFHFYLEHIKSLEDIIYKRHI